MSEIYYQRVNIHIRMKRGGAAMKKTDGPSEKALKEFYEAILPGLIRIAKEEANKNQKESAS